MLIPGKTGSGKTTLAKRLATDYQRAGRGVLVYDPMQDPAWRAIAEHVYANDDRYLAAVRQARSCMLIVDESPDMLEGRRPPGAWLATQARHLGHMAHFICRRPMDLAPTIRDQCTHLLVFRMGWTWARELAVEHAAPDVEAACTLPLGQYLYARPDGRTTRHRLW